MDGEKIYLSGSCFCNLLTNIVRYYVHLQTNLQYASCFHYSIKREYEEIPR